MTAVMALRCFQLAHNADHRISQIHVKEPRTVLALTPIALAMQISLMALLASPTLPHKDIKEFATKVHALSQISNSVQLM